MQESSISVVLPNFNGRSLLERNLPSLIIALEHAGLPYQIIVSDDASTDDSIAFLAEQYPSIVVVESSLNQGFSATCNKGIAAATNRILCVTNTDVTFTPDYFSLALPYFTVPNVYAVKGDIINYEKSFEHPINIERTSLLYYKQGFLRFNQRVNPTPVMTGQIDGQFVLLGCCFVCDREKTQTLLGYDEIYSPFYWEDADLALRAVRHGYQLIYAPECRVYHQISSTISKTQTNNRRRLISIRNKFIFTWHHLTGVRNWLTHIAFTGLSLALRWVILDWRYYVSFAWALGRQLTHQSPKDIVL